VSVRLSVKEYQALQNSKGQTKAKTKKAKPQSLKIRAFDAQFFGENEFIMPRDTSHYKALSYLQNHPEELSSDCEHYEQTFVFHYFDVHHPSIFDMMFAIPNAGKRSQKVAGQFLAEGLKKGVPDIFVDIAIDPYHGLRVELKRSTVTVSNVSDEQWEWLDKYEARGYKAGVAIGYRECIDLICGYFGITSKLKKIATC